MKSILNDGKILHDAASSYDIRDICVDLGHRFSYPMVILLVEHSKKTLSGGIKRTHNLYFSVQNPHFCEPILRSRSVKPDLEKICALKTEYIALSKRGWNIFSLSIERDLEKDFDSGGEIKSNFSDKPANEYTNRSKMIECVECDNMLYSLFLNEEGVEFLVRIPLTKEKEAMGASRSAPAPQRQMVAGQMVQNSFISDEDL